jgi:hypothetical protein
MWGDRDAWRARHWLALLFVGVVATPAMARAATGGAASASALKALPAAPACGTRPDDWCPAPAGDPCGRHESEGSCRSDRACRGIPYRGESVVACAPDGKGFWSNCPAVGCMSRYGAPHAPAPPEVVAALCHNPRWGGADDQVRVWRTAKGEASILELDPAAERDRGIRIFTDLAGNDLLTLPAHLPPGSDLARELDRERASWLVGLQEAETLRCR